MKELKEVVYKEAVKRISAYIDHHGKINVFDASLILAYIFDIHKEIILEDLIAYRTKQERDK
jgi:5'-3' exonuclease